MSMAPAAFAANEDHLALVHPLRFVGLTNSLRPDSFNAMALRLAATVLPEGATLDIVDLQPLPFYDVSFDRTGFPDTVRAVAEAIAASDGLVVAVPEYNHSIPGVLKNAIDCLSRYPGDPLRDKPAMILSATRGPLGGARVQYELRRVFDSVGTLPLVRPEVFIGMAHLKFNGDGRCIDDATRHFVQAQSAAFCEWIKRAHRWNAREPQQARPQSRPDLPGGVPHA